MQLFKKHIENMIKEKQKGIDIYMVEKDKIYAPVSGKIIPLEEVEDAVFSQKIMGDGVGIEPVEGYLYAPVDGKISVVFPTGHVIGIESEDGAGIIMHVGIDTVELKGNGFEVFVEQGSSGSSYQMPYCLLQSDTCNYPASNQQNQKIFYVSAYLPVK